MQVWIKSNPHRYVLIGANDNTPIILWDFKASEHLGLEQAPEIVSITKKSKTPNFTQHNHQVDEVGKTCVEDIKDVAIKMLGEYCIGIVFFFLFLFYFLVIKKCIFFGNLTIKAIKNK